MALSLSIENEARLPDGGPLTYELTGHRGADIGRDAHLDWTLPDPARHVSGKHCEIRFTDGSYWLKDVSSNGTFLNGSLQRVQSPYCLKSGDRLLIGHYIIAVEVTDENGAAPRGDEALPAMPFDAEDLWGGAVGAAEPSDPRDLRPASQFVPVKPDFLEWAVDVPDSPGSGFVARPVAASAAVAAPESDGARVEPFSWDAGAMPTPAPLEPSPPVPTPRRSLWVGPGPDRPWSGDDDAPAPAPVQPVRPMPSDIAARDVPRPAAPAAPALPRDAGGDVVTRFAKGAGIPPDTLASRDIGDFAEWVGRLMLLVTDNVKQMLDARGQAEENHAIVEPDHDRGTRQQPAQVLAQRRRCPADHAGAAHPQLSRRGTSASARFRRPQSASAEDVLGHAAGLEPHVRGSGPQVDRARTSGNHVHRRLDPLEEVPCLGDLRGAVAIQGRPQRGQPARRVHAILCRMLRSGDRDTWRASMTLLSRFTTKASDVLV